MAPKRENRLKEIRENGIVLTQKEVACLLSNLYLPEGETIDSTTVSKHENGRGLTPEKVEAYTRLYKLDQDDKPGSVLLFLSPEELEENQLEDEPAEDVVE